MSPRIRKLIGSFAVVTFMAVYIWLATIIAARLRITARPSLRFRLAGIGWGVPLFPFITWMQRPR
jgi:hypothetical protein